MSRRGFLLGALAVVAAPALIRPGLLMPVKPWRRGFPWEPSTHVMLWMDDKAMASFTEAEFAAEFPAPIIESFTRGRNVTRLVPTLVSDRRLEQAWREEFTPSPAVSGARRGVHRHLSIVREHGPDWPRNISRLIRDAARGVA
jgi:hypothetical protein